MNLGSFFKMDAANAEGTTTGGDSGNNTPATISAEEAQALRDQLAAEKKEKATLAGKVTELSTAVESMKKNSLKGKEEYKTLFEDAEKKLEAANTEVKTLKESIFHTSRVSAVKDAAVKLGLRSEALSDIEGFDLDEVKVTVGDDRIIRTEGQNDFAERLKKSKPYLFKTPGDPVFNGGGGGGGGADGVTVTQKMLADSYATRNKGPKEKAAYLDLVKKHDEQTRKARAK